MNSCQKGKRGERAWRDELREAGYEARRGRQFSGSPESPDVVCDDLPFAHWEVKWVENLNIVKAMEQARRDAGKKLPFVAHRRNGKPWLVTMDVETFFAILREGEGALQCTDSSKPDPVQGAEENGLDNE